MLLRADMFMTHLCEFGMHHLPLVLSQLEEGLVSVTNASHSTSHNTHGSSKVGELQTDHAGMPTNPKEMTDFLTATYSLLTSAVRRHVHVPRGSPGAAASRHQGAHARTTARPRCRQDPTGGLILLYRHILGIYPGLHRESEHRLYSRSGDYFTVSTIWMPALVVDHAGWMYLYLDMYVLTPLYSRRVCKLRPGTCCLLLNAQGVFHEDRTEEFLFFLQKLAELKGETANARHLTRDIRYHSQPPSTKRYVNCIATSTATLCTIPSLTWISLPLATLGVMYRRLAMTVEEDLHNSTLLRELTERRKHAQDELETLQRNLANERREKERYDQHVSLPHPQGTGKGTRSYTNAAS